MDSKPWFWKRSGFPPVFWTVVALAWYVFQLDRMNLGEPKNYIIYLFVDGIVFGFSLLVWLGFFAQFVLPVNRFGERQQIFSRLIRHILGRHGPAIFVLNGQPREHKGESKKKGPGVLWLDSASAGQLRTFSKFTRTIGPGVHFTRANETPAGYVDLHSQVQIIGPTPTENPFEPKSEGMDEATYKNQPAQKRRTETSGLTRDGIEGVPTISVTFKIDAEPVKGDGPGSRFGFPPVDPDAPEEHPVFKAIAGEGIKPLSGSEDQSVAWNQLPAFVAADLWREYASKFTLQELFETAQSMPPKPVRPIQPDPEDTTQMFLPIKVGPRRSPIRDGFAEILHEVNRFLERIAVRLERQRTAEPADNKASTAPEDSPSQESKVGTALELISEMITARMKLPEVPELDSNGKPLRDESGEPIWRPMKFEHESEFQLLKRRGLKVITVSISNLRFAPSVEEQLVRRWNASWLQNARDERDTIERLRRVKEMGAQEESLRTYVHEVSRGLMKQPPTNNKDVIKNLIMRSRSLIMNNDRMHRRLTTEPDELQEIIQWLES